MLQSVPIVCTFKIRVHPDVLYLNLEPRVAGIRPPRGKNLNDVEFLALALVAGIRPPRGENLNDVEFLALALGSGRNLLIRALSP